MLTDRNGTILDKEYRENVLRFLKSNALGEPGQYRYSDACDRATLSALEQKVSNGGTTSPGADNEPSSGNSSALYEGTEQGNKLFRLFAVKAFFSEFNVDNHTAEKS